jgi:hypothetical protein
VINRGEDPDAEGLVLANPRAQFVEAPLFQDMRVGESASAALV